MWRSFVRLVQILVLLLYLAITSVCCAFAGWRWRGWHFANCAIFAVLREHESGGYIIFRRSHHGWWYHIEYAEDLQGEFEEYNPLWPKDVWHWWRPPFLFRGKVNRFTR